MFQFQCPYGHLLQADETQAGQHSTCPLCGTMFIVPAPLTPALYVPPAVPPPEPEPTRETPYCDEPEAPPEEPAAASEVPAEDEPAVATPFALQEPDLVHIPCPNGHVLETPVEMLDQEVLCPECQAQFVLQRTNSTEYKQAKELERQRRDQRKDRALINFAIVVVVLVVVGVLVLILATPGD